MIVVIADDISGAAELAGAALRHGLSAEVQTAFDARADADVLCVDTDSRSLAATEAAVVVDAVARRVVAAGPAWIYKKCDSVLRGSVLAETRAMLGALDKRHALLVPANPARGRVIRDGDYFVGEQRLHETLFGRDPEHPRTTSRVADLLGGTLESVTVPDTRNAADVAAHAAAIDDATLPVGGVDFFEALLLRRGCTAAAREKPSSPSTGRGTALLVCGSAATWGGRRNDAIKHGVPVFELPCRATEVCATLQGGGRALVGIGKESALLERTPTDLVHALADVVASVVRESELKRLLLEGGATAAAVVRALGWTRLRACEVAAFGGAVVAPSGTPRPRVFIKPGSYAWPSEIWPGI